MRVLVLGGTLFLGRHLVDAALARGHRVTLFNRGTRAAPSPEVEAVHGDRDGGLDALKGRRWDVVIDTSGYVPRLVGASARLLAVTVDRSVYISSASVYADLDAMGLDESARVDTMDDPTSEDIAAHYGALKALCERAVDDAMPGRALHVRAGMIVGPFDPTGRFAYWVRRVADGGDVLAPGDPRRPVQLVHARDLSDWIIAMAESGRVGVFNATGPSGAIGMSDLLDACAIATNSDATFAWVDDGFLLDQGVAPFTDMPFWLPREQAGLLALDASKAIGAGLRFRSLVDIVRDTARWTATTAVDGAATRLASGVATRAGIDRGREAALLAAWRSGVRPGREPCNV